MHSKKELRSVALMDTPESLKLGSHDPRRKVQRRPSTADKSTTGRRQRGDAKESSATIGAQCMGPSKAVDDDEGTRSPGFDKDLGRRLVLLSSMPKLDKMQFDEEIGSGSSSRSLENRPIVETADRKYEGVTKVNGRLREAADIAASNTVDGEIERLTDEIKRLELRLADQRPISTLEEEIDRGRKSANTENRLRGESARMEMKSDEELRQSLKSAYSRHRSNDVLSKHSQGKRRTSYRSKEIFLSDDDSDKQSASQKHCRPSSPEVSSDEKITGRQSSSRELRSRQAIRRSVDGRSKHSNGEQRTSGREEGFSDYSDEKSAQQSHSRLTDSVVRSKRFHDKQRIGCRRKRIFMSDDDSEEQSARQNHCRPNDSVVSSDEEMTSGQRRADITTKSDRDSHRKRDRSYDREKDKKRPHSEQQIETSSRQRKDCLKLDRYDGSTALETFRIQFETCSEYNGWNEFDRLAQLKAALRGAAAQVMLGDSEPTTCQELWADLQQNFGTSGHEAQFESQLKVCRRQKGESLRSLYQDINRLTLQAYPDSKGKLREKLAIEAFIVGLNNSELALQVRNMSPVDLQGAYRMALMLESNRSLVERADESRDRKKDVRFDVSARAVADDDSDLIQRVRRLEERWSEQKSAQPTKKEAKSLSDVESKVIELERELERVRSVQAAVKPSERGNVDRPHQSEYAGPTEQRLEQQLRFPADFGNSGASRQSAPMHNASYNSNEFSSKADNERWPTVICYYCGVQGHKASLCLQRPCLHCSQFGHTIKQCPVFETHRRDNLCFNCGKPGHRSRNCVQQKRTERDRNNFSAMKLACAAGSADKKHKVYLKMSADGVERQFLLDSGCDTTIVPLNFVKNHPIRPTRKTVSAANGTTIELAGEVSIQLQLGSLTIPTTALVSEYVGEGMIGYDWLQQNDCYWGFRVGQIMIHNQIFPLVGGDESRPAVV